ncbi:hypothetical protein N479_26430, partial [Pseudoalteromonas luteoviolacea S4054]
SSMDGFQLHVGKIPVHCRAGSLENITKMQSSAAMVHCRTGSLGDE